MPTTTDDLKPLQEKCKIYGLHLNTIMIPIDWLKPPMFGAPDRDKWIENIRRSVRAGAEAGIKVFEWRWSPDFKWGADVGYYIPNRLDEGYGLNDKALDTLIEIMITMVD